MAKHDSIPVSSGKLPLFAPFAVPKIGNMATAWHEILHLGTKQRHSAGSIVKVEGETCFDLFYIDEGKVHVVFDTIDGRMRSFPLKREASSTSLPRPPGMRHPASIGA